MTLSSKDIPQQVLSSVHDNSQCGSMLFWNSRLDKCGTFDQSDKFLRFLNLRPYSLLSYADAVAAR